MSIDDEASKLDFEAHVDEQVTRATERSVVMSGALEKLFTTVGFDPQLIKDYGVVLLDIEAGRDVAALKDFNPKVIYACEPDNTLLRDSMKSEADKDLIMPEDVKREVLRTMFESAGVPLTQLVREDFTTGLEKIINRLGGSQVGAVMALNMFPSRSQREQLLGVLEQSKGILVEGGIVLFGVDGSMRSSVDGLMKEKIDGYDMHYVPYENLGENSALGEVLLVAQKVVYNPS